MLICLMLHAGRDLIYTRSGECHVGYLNHVPAGTRAQPAPPPQAPRITEGTGPAVGRFSQQHLEYMGFEHDLPGLQVAVPPPATSTHRDQGDLGRRLREGLAFVTEDSHLLGQKGHHSGSTTCTERWVLLNVFSGAKEGQFSQAYTRPEEVEHA